VNRKLVDEAPLGARIADSVTSLLGSWTFIVIQTVIVFAWILGNVYLFFHFDPYPFILLNLAFAAVSAYAAPLLLLAGNRAALRDRMTLEHAATEADKEYRQNEQLLHGDKEILERNTQILEHVQRLEERILSLEQRIGRLLGEPPDSGSRAASGQESGPEVRG
jgi:uncharacterized membrane protein